MSRLGSRFVGIFGGTFDPIHYGHLRIAEELVETLNLREIRFIPAGAPRLRTPPIASPYHRTAMVQAAIQSNAHFILDEREVHRPGTNYSVDTFRELRQEMGEDVTLCLVMGADAFMKFTEWHDWHDLFSLCHIIIAARPGHDLTTRLDSLPQALREESTHRWARSLADLESAPCGLIYIAPTSPLDISSTAIRTLIITQSSARYLLPDAVLDYIETNHLYSGEE
jgi:nicotinate-nucleotide adenylyltransferase